MKTRGYGVTLSTERQNYQSLKVDFYEYANKHGWQIDHIIETKMSNRRGGKERYLNVLKDAALCS